MLSMERWFLTILASYPAPSLYFLSDTEAALKKMSLFYYESAFEHVYNLTSYTAATPAVDDDDDGGGPCVRDSPPY